MRRRALLLVAALAVSAAATALPTAPAADAAGTPPACPFTNGSQRYCNRYTTAGPVGSIGLLGDSVLLGSADGASNPGLPSMLAAKGWGPINLVATLGMKTKWTADNNVSAVYWLNRWHTNGFHPDVIAVNLGANHLGYWDNPACTTANYSYCRTAILQVMDEIALHHPTARVWWAKVNYQPFGGGSGAAMLGWNKALDEVAAERPNLVPWDWPTALATANPAISMDTNRIHPSSAPQYVKRSTLMATHITDHLGAARFVGPRAAVPPAASSALGYQNLDPTMVFDSLAVAPGLIPGATTTEIDMGSAVPEGTAAVDVILTTASAQGTGYLTVYPCGEAMPTVSSLNYALNTPRAAQAIVRLSPARRLCIYNSTTTAIRVHLVGRFAVGTPLRFTPITPQRPLDTRNTGKAADLQATVPSAVAVAVTVTVTQASSGGIVALQKCGTTDPPLAVLAYQPNETAAGAAFATQWADRTICLKVLPNAPGDLPQVILDVTGTFRADGALAYVPAQAARLLDTRIALGGWVARHGTGQTLDIVAAPAGAQAVTGTITMVRPMFKGWLTAYQCGQPVPPTSSVNARAGVVMANSVTVGIDPTQRTLCIRSSENTNSLFDAVGWWVVPTS